jgi:uncharacterized membrane protein YidH (DUF202 family)
MEPRELAQRYRCPFCDLLVAIDEKACRHCGQVFSDVHRAEMREAYRQNAKAMMPTVIVAFVIVVAIVASLVYYVAAG